MLNKTATLLLASLLLFPAQAIAQPTVSVDTGTLRGTEDGALRIFKGIPYASPPVGSLRWEPPAKPAHWAGTRDASAFGAVCPQPAQPDRKMASGNQKQSEDCLFANIWSFKDARNAPVMVWIHGGALRVGSGSAKFYDGSDFAKDGVILVTFNYRLGALGFFAHPALTKAAGPDAPLANYGIMDQIAMLRWVKRNIAAFGGDPDNVTIFGESAGGSSILALLTVPPAKGLFAKAIVESGGGWQAGKTLADAEATGVSLAKSAGLGPDATLAQLRALPPQKLFALPFKIGGLGPFVDGRLIKQSVPAAFAAGDETDVPLIIGSNSYEASLLKTFKIAPDAIVARIPPVARPLYPADVQVAADDVFTDSVMGAPARWIAAEASSGAPSWLYHFSYVSTARRGKVPGAAHGSEIPFVFGSWPEIFRQFASPEDESMEKTMHACWVSFAKSGKPACGDKAWPAYSAQSDTMMEFATASGPHRTFRKAQYDSLQQVLLRRKAGDGE
ncbi:MAG: carboxylesterase family protein [Proteobacteria bacterium]|nr:carboxylesterase family protein [Pseudomonadota bacterium]